MIAIKNLDPKLLNIDKILFKSTDAVTYHIKYITMKSLGHVNIDCENSLYLVFNNVDGHIIEQNNEDKYLTFASEDKNKEIIEKYKKIWSEIKNQIETINGGKPIEYKKIFTKIRFESDDYLPLGKILNIPVMVINGSVFKEGNKCYPQVLLHECVYESEDKLYKICIVLLVRFFRSICFYWH